MSLASVALSSGYGHRKAALLHCNVRLRLVKLQTMDEQVRDGARSFALLRSPPGPTGLVSARTLV